ncbi:hypothetical protein C6502_17325, partial [Candidatus Poribacteria bacterium]
AVCPAEAVCLKVRPAGVLVKPNAGSWFELDVGFHSIYRIMLLEGRISIALDIDLRLTVQPNLHYCISPRWLGYVYPSGASLPNNF